MEARWRCGGRVTRWWGVMMFTAALSALAVGGCVRGTDSQQRSDVTNQAPLEGVLEGGGLEEQRAREIMAEATGARVQDVTLVAKSAVEGIAVVMGSIPADPKLLPLTAGSPDEQDYNGEQPRVEAVTVRWDLMAGRPVDIAWSERLQFAAEEPVNQQQALAIAEELKSKWFPEVPAKMVMDAPHRLNRPAWVLAWHGQAEDGTLTGDEVVVQVSTVTGLPIAYTQRIAPQRPKPESVKITRDQAIAAARAAFEAGGWAEGKTAPLVAELMLSSPAHPEGGPAWTVESPVGQGDAVAIVDAMTGDVISSGKGG